MVGVCTLIREEPAKRNPNALAGQVCAHESRNARQILDGTESGQAAPDVPVHLRRPGGVQWPLCWSSGGLHGSKGRYATFLLRPKVLVDDPLGLPLIGLARLAGKVNLRWRGVGEGHLHLVAQARLPFGKALAEVGDAGLQRRIVDEVAGFVRVGLEIKELEVADFGVADEFVTLVTDGALDVEEGQKDGVADGSLAAGEEGLEGLALEALGDVEAIIGGENDDGVAGLAGFFERFEDAADLRVEVRHEGVVFGELAANDAFGAGPGGKVFVADVAHHAVVKAELGLVIVGVSGGRRFS